MNISGNFKTIEEEIDAVKHFLEKMNIDLSTCSVDKYRGDGTQNPNTVAEGDIIAEFKNGKSLLFEVKQERYNRFSKFGELGFDMISAFQFKEGKAFDKFVHNPADFGKFVATVDRKNPHFKWGKIVTSTSDIWLFYVKDPKDKYIFCEGYDFAKMKKEKVASELKKVCQFAVNNKNESQLSHSDTWQSATFFVKPELIKKYKITPEKFNEMI